MPSPDRTIGKLVLSVGGRVLRELLIDSKRVTIGRRPYNDLLLDDLTVSGEHAIVHTGPKGESVVHDLQSRNGTLVNGVPVMQQVLADGDVIDVGIYRIVYCIERLGINVKAFMPQELPRLPVTRIMEGPPGASLGAAGAAGSQTGFRSPSAPSPLPRQGRSGASWTAFLDANAKGAGTVPAGTGAGAGVDEGAGVDPEARASREAGAGSEAGAGNEAGAGGEAVAGGEARVRRDADAASGPGAGNAAGADDGVGSGRGAAQGPRAGLPAGPGAGGPAVGNGSLPPVAEPPMPAAPAQPSLRSQASIPSGPKADSGPDQKPAGGPDSPLPRPSMHPPAGPQPSSRGPAPGFPGLPAGASGDVRRFVPPKVPAPVDPLRFGRVMIRYLGGHDAGREIVMDRPIVSIRNGSGQVAVIARRQGGYYLTHLEGLAYPLVNGESIGLGAHPLRDNDLIELAGTILQFCFDGPAP